MFKTKTAFVIFLVLSVIVFPYYIIYINSDFFSSVVPGWHTSIDSARIVSALIKFIILSLITFFYWKLSRITDAINLKNFIIHLLMTVPGILVAKINVYHLLNFSSFYSDFFITRIQIVIGIHAFVNMLFYLGQILFGIFYIKLQKKILVSNK